MRYLSDYSVLWNNKETTTYSRELLNIYKYLKITATFREMSVCKPNFKADN
jgi:hypothetical protein